MSIAHAAARRRRPAGPAQAARRQAAPAKAPTHGRRLATDTPKRPKGRPKTRRTDIDPSDRDRNIDPPRSVAGMAKGRGEQTQKPPKRPGGGVVQTRVPREVETTVHHKDSRTDLAGQLGDAFKPPARVEKRVVAQAARMPSPSPSQSQKRRKGQEH